MLYRSSCSKAFFCASTSCSEHGDLVTWQKDEREEGQGRFSNSSDTRLSSDKSSFMRLLQQLSYETRDQKPIMISPDYYYRPPPIAINRSQKREVGFHPDPFSPFALPPPLQSGLHGAGNVDARVRDFLGKSGFNDMFPCQDFFQVSLLSNTQGFLVGPNRNLQTSKSLLESQLIRSLQNILTYYWFSSLLTFSVRSNTTTDPLIGSRPCYIVHPV